MSLSREHDGLGAGIHVELAEDAGQVVSDGLFADDRIYPEPALLHHQACAALLLQVHLIDRQSSLCCDHFDECVLWRPRQ